MFLDLAIEPQTQSLPVSDLWRFLPIGYLFTIAIETPVLVVGLSKKASLSQRIWCGVWLTACTYPIVVLVLPTIFLNSSRILYLSVAEIFAPAAECALFWLAFRGRLEMNASEWARSFAAIIIANL